MRVLIACEESQTVCKAFRERGHEAFSCDILPCSGGHPEWHLQMDAFDAIELMDWDMMIAHPPCTYLSYAGTQSWNNPGQVFLRLQALDFFAKLWECGINKICLENPKGCASPVIAKYSQEIQPYYFGEPYFKTTWLWLRNLPKLEYAKADNLFEIKTATDKPEPLSIDNTIRAKRRHWTESGSNAKNRSKTFSGIAAAMAEQWGGIS